MRKFLVVGCGGSGGATLAFMMDQLKADLAEHGVQKIPAGWQFLHVDVPTSAGKVDGGVATASDQGAKYIPTGATSGGTYQALDNAVTQKLIAKSALDTAATWMPRDPDQISFPVSRGAGQFRVLGRVITLSQIGRVYEDLIRVWDVLNKPDTDSEMFGLSVPGLGKFDPADPTIVLVVSSMAGGAGASMALDVCRVLTMIPGLTPGLMGVFMVTPDIFKKLEASSIPGVRPNALAMLGEIVAGQTGAARAHDVALLQGLGLHKGEGAQIPFARVFPVGGGTGELGAEFGDGSAEAVYRGLARGLSALILSENATRRFDEWDLTNTAGIAFDRSTLGWGAGQSSKLSWGAFGFASLSMGRDRYKEYAAQRLAHSSVDHLLTGHRESNDSATDGERIKALLDNQWPNLCASLGLPLAGAKTVESWLTVVLPMPTGQQLAGTLVESTLRQNMPQGIGVAANQWSDEVGSRLAGRRDELLGRARQVAELEAFKWQNAFVARTEAAVTAALAERGMPYATALLKRIRQQLEFVVAPAGPDLLAHAPGPSVAEVPAEVRSVVGAMRGLLSNAAELLEKIMTGVKGKVLRQIYAELGSYVAKSAGVMTTELIDPLVDALDEAQRSLRASAAEPAGAGGVAYLKTNEYAAWPSESDAKVAPRFAEADNEVMLTSSDQYIEQYAVHLPRSVGVAASGASALKSGVSLAVGRVITGMWDSQSGFPAPATKRPVIERTSDWRSSAFATNPETGAPAPAQRAVYELHMRPAELLDRARKFIARPGEEFDRFGALSLRDFAIGTDNPGESEIARRQRDIEIKFEKALSLARPLAAVNEQAVQEIHKVTQMEYRYKFSTIPFANNPVADALAGVLGRQRRVDLPTKLAFPEELSMEPGIKRIDIFGSYPNYSPLAYTSVIGPAADQWQASSPAERKDFWRWRRCRPLSAALPMHPSERRVCVGGWLLGNAVGFIQVPPEPYTQPVSVWDTADETWRYFPNPLLTPPSEFLADYDWLPAVLESVLLAIATSQQAPVMASMKPYQALRRIYDETAEDPMTGNYTLAARTNLARFLRSGDSGTTVRSVISGVGPDVGIDERAALVKDYFQTFHDFAGHHFMAAGEGVGSGQPATGGGAFSTITSRAMASKTPFFRDLAPDVFWASQQLINLIPQCVEDARKPEDPGPRFSGTAPTHSGPDVIEIPTLRFGGSTGSGS